MKSAFAKLLGMIALISPVQTFAQSYDTTTFFGKMSYIFEHANTSNSQIPTGLLKDYGIDFLNLDNFNGQFISDSNFAGLSEWRCLYASIYSFQISTNGIPGVDTLNQKLKQYNSSSIPVHFATLYYAYQTVDPSAVTNHLLSVTGGQVYDVAGRSQSPYDTKEVFGVAPIVQGLFVGTNELEFTPDMLFTNTGKTVSTIKIDPTGSGTYQAVTYNTPIMVTYDTLGFYNINVQYTFTDGTVRTAHTQVTVCSFPLPDGGFVFNGDRFGYRYFGSGPPFFDGNNEPYFLRDYGNQASYTSKKIVASRTFNGVKDSAYIIVNYAHDNTSGQLKKPLIVVEGFNDVSVDQSGQ